jgi:anti-sigma regulatory factor (Ser/Thr protein kinase)
VSAIRDVSLELPATVESATSARRALDALRVDAREVVLFNLRLLVTELISNSVRHAQLSPTDLIMLKVELHPSFVRVLVVDPGPGFRRPEIAKQPPTGTAGRGLYIVDALADRWGVEPTPEHDRCLAWFELELQ